MNTTQDLPPIPSPSPAPRRAKTATWIWIVVGLVVLCLCCVLLAVGGYFLRDQVPAIGNLLYTLFAVEKEVFEPEQVTARFKAWRDLFGGDLTAQAA